MTWSLCKAGSGIGSRLRPRAGFAGLVTGLKRACPVAPVLASTYQFPSCPSSTAERGGKGGGTPASKERGGPGRIRRRVADQRAWPDCSSAAMTAPNCSGATSVRAPSSRDATALASTGAAGSAAMRAGVVPSNRRVCSSSRTVDTIQAKGGLAAPTSNSRRFGAGASALAGSSGAAGTGRRSIANRSSAARPAAATWAQAGWPQVQRMLNVTSPARAAGVSVARRRCPASATAAVIDSPANATSTAPNRTRLRPRVSMRGSNKARRSSAEYGVGMQCGTLVVVEQAGGAV